MNRVPARSEPGDHPSPDTVKFSLRDIGIMSAMAAACMTWIWAVFGGLEHRVTVVETKVDRIERFEKQAKGDRNIGIFAHQKRADE